MNRGFPAEARVEFETDVWRSIVDVAHQLEATVVVLGSRGLHGLRGLIEGDISHEFAIHTHARLELVSDTNGSRRARSARAVVRVRKGV